MNKVQNASMAFAALLDEDPTDTVNLLKALSVPELEDVRRDARMFIRMIGTALARREPAELPSSSGRPFDSWVITQLGSADFVHPVSASYELLDVDVTVRGSHSLLGLPYGLNVTRNHDGFIKQVTVIPRDEPRWRYAYPVTVELRRSDTGG